MLDFAWNSSCGALLLVGEPYIGTERTGEFYSKRKMFVINASSKPNQAITKPRNSRNAANV